MLDVPAELLRYLSRLLAAERRLRGTPARSRRLTCRDQAVLALRWFRDRTRIEQLGRDHGVSRATAYRYVAEAVDVLSQQAPGLAEALERAMAEGVPYLILDGKVFGTDRCSEPLTSVKGHQIDAWYSGKASRHGGNVQAVMRPGGLPLRAGPAEPGSVHDITAARVHALPALYRAAALGMPTLADSGYEGAGIGILVPVKNPAGNQELDIGTRTRNALLRDLRCRGERGFALLTQRWAVLQHITASPSRITEITRAALVLTQFEHKYIR
ncbi:MAG: IS5/IS1182 family transposase [Actinomycetota bacterium]|nr:IS5/IS1182 family transposase [Actinomycetota bacterium]